MSLIEYQSLLARLWTDAALREQFARDPRGVGAQYRLNPRELEDLLALSLSDIQYFADSLQRKRCQEVAHFLPLTERALGDRYALLFARYANGHPPRGPNGLRADASGFARFLAGKLEPPWRELPRYEAAWLRMAQERRCWLVQRFGYPVQAWRRAIECNEPIGDILPAPHLALWWRWRSGHPIRHRLLPLSQPRARDRKS